MSVWRKWIRRIVISLAIFVGIASLVLRTLWDDRPGLDDIDWPVAEVTSTITNEVVTVTWLGVTTLLFDDGETQILIDGFFSRPSLIDSVFNRPVDNDAAMINYAINEFRMRRLAAIIPVHSHYDHAMDVGAIANRSSASVLGSESTAQIARGAGVPEEQIIVAAENTIYEFGEFKIKLIAAPHAPIGWGGAVPMDGSINSPLAMPQPISAFRMGGAWSIIVEHPQGTALVQGSAGFEKYALRGTQVDVVFLGVGLLDSISREHAELFWQHTVTATGANAVYPVHFDDFTKPFGEIVPPPRMLSNMSTIVEWLEQFRDRWDRDVRLHLPHFGEPIAIYAVSGS